jgi:hypothetical protein
MAAAVWFAGVSSLERVLGPWSTSIGAIALFWGLLGALVALATVILIPHRWNERGAAS